jgi:DGQHR domain-containing protein
MEVSMKVKSLRIGQNGRSLYITSLPVKELSNKGKIDQWNPEINESQKQIDDLISVQGYQRAPIRTHYTKIGKYVSENNDALLPTAILVNSRDKLDFAEDVPGSGFGTLEIKDTAKIFIVDGQHRVFGLQYAIDELGMSEIEDFQLPVVIMDQVGKVEEMRHFFLVNSTQKKVRTDLAERLLRLIAMKDGRVMKDLKEKEKDWKLRAVKVIDTLINDPNSVWHKRIKRPNEPARPEAVASEGSFSTSLRPILTSEFAANEDDQVVVAWINSFWHALKDLMPETFSDPKKYVIQKTPGMYSLHMVFPFILYECAKARDFSKNKMKEILKKDQDHFEEPEFWASGGDGAAHYNSVGAFRILSSEIKEALK